MKTYKHLNKEERDLLAVLVSQGQSLRSIAQQLKRAPSTILREIKRNRPTRGRQLYFPHKAQERALWRHHHGHRRKRLKTLALRMEVMRFLMRGWSPEIISGRIKRQGRLPTISHEAIYQWIYSQAPHFFCCLPRAHPKRSSRFPGRRRRRFHIPGRVSIQERPAAINARHELGHWETDLIVGRGRQAIQVTVERSSRFTRLRRIPNKTAPVSSQALVATLKSLPPRLRRSMTYDNGGENAQHLRLKKAFGMDSYFCDPFHSWEKGTIENTNGLIRRFIPKQTDLGIIPKEDIRFIETWLNARPRKCLQFQTPAEFLENLGVALTG